MKNLYLNYEGFEDYLVKRIEHSDGVRYEFHFANGYGASVVKHIFTDDYHKDLWQLAVKKFYRCDRTWRLTYNSPITNDVICSLTDEEVRNLMEQIKGL